MGCSSNHLGVVQQAGDLVDPIQLSHFRGGRRADADVIEQEPLGRPRLAEGSRGDPLHGDGTQAWHARKRHAATADVSGRSAGCLISNAAAQLL